MSSYSSFIRALERSTIKFLSATASGNEKSVLRIPVDRDAIIPSNAQSVQVKAVDGLPFTTIPGSQFESPGKAVRNVDYTVEEVTTLSWLPGERGIKYVEIRLLDVAVFKQFHLVLQSPSPDATLVSTIIVIDILPLPTGAGEVGFLQPTFISGDDRTLVVDVQRMNGNGGAISVDYVTEDGTGTAGVDYVASSGQLLWADGDSAPKQVTLTLKNVSANKNFYLRLLNPGGDATLFDLNNPARIDIQDAPVGVGDLAMSLSEIQIGESSTLTVKVRRVNGKTGAVGCTYGTSDGTAIAGTHYTTATNTLAWADQDDAEKSFTVPILSVTDLRYFFATLSLPTGGVGLLAGYEQAKVSILDGASVPPSNQDDILEVEGMFLPFLEETIVDDVDYSKGEATIVYATGLQGGIIGLGNGAEETHGGGSDIGTDDFYYIDPAHKARIKRSQVAGLG